MSTETYIATEDGVLTAITIARIGEQLFTLIYEDTAGAVDHVQPFPTDIDLGDYIKSLTDDGLERTQAPWNVYAVDIACERGQWTYLASHNPAAPLEDWAREQLALCMASADQPWTVRVHQHDADGKPAGSPIAEVTGGR